jgi:hypothetical protein
MVSTNRQISSGRTQHQPGLYYSTTGYKTYFCKNQIHVSKTNFNNKFEYDKVCSDAAKESE